ncbi:MAG TPA: ATPase [Myxococcales bacterium]|nr:ATPase [Myxococcales bacterium]
MTELPNIFARRFVIVSGKGGVGKSTVSAVLGLCAAKAGLRTCILQLHTRDALGPIWGIDAGQYEPAQVSDALPLWICNLEPKQALREYGVMKLRFAALHRLVFENDVMQRLLKMIPGMDETFLLGKAWYMEEMERDAHGTPKWDLLIVDAPSTGHGLGLFRLPEVLLQAVPVGPMAQDAKRMKDMLTDPKRCSFNIVTLPQELPVNEALELARQARQEVGVPSGHVIVNQVLPDLLGELSTERLQGLDAGGDSNFASALTDARAYQRWVDQQQQQIERLEDIGPLIELPHLLRPMDQAGLAKLGDTLVEQMLAHPLPAMESR